MVEEDDATLHSSTPSTATSSVAVFTPIVVPVLRSDKPKRVGVILKERERYDLEIKGKQAEVASLAVASWTASGDHALLKNLVYMGKFDTLAPSVTNSSNLTDTHIENYVRSLVTRDTSFEPTAIESALKSLKFPTHTTILTHVLPYTAAISLIAWKPSVTAIENYQAHVAKGTTNTSQIRDVQSDEKLYEKVTVFVALLTKEAIHGIRILQDIRSEMGEISGKDHLSEFVETEVKAIKRVLHHKVLHRKGKNYRYAYGSPMLIKVFYNT